MFSSAVARFISTMVISRIFNVGDTAGCRLIWIVRNRELVRLDDADVASVAIDYYTRNFYRPINETFYVAIY